MLFFITMKKYVLNVAKPKLPVEPNKTQINDYQYWVEDDLLVKKIILNGLTDDLYYYYNSDKFIKKIYGVLQKKYNIEEI